MEEEISMTCPQILKKFYFDPSDWPMEEQINTKDLTDFE